MVPELSWAGISQAFQKPYTSLVAHLVQLHKPLPQAVNLLAVDYVLLASISQPRQRSVEHAVALAAYVQLDPEAMLSSSPDCWLPISAVGLG
jgi:hypothetical protein